MSINRKELEEIATLAKLNVPENQGEEIKTALNQVMAMIDHIGSVDTSGVKPMAHPVDAWQITREDVISDQNHKSELLNLAPNADSDHYLVPKVIE